MRFEPYQNVKVILLKDQNFWITKFVQTLLI